MAKEFLDELIEELNKLKDSEAERVYAAIEARKFPPIPLTPLTVMKTVNRVAMNHKVTAEELQSLLGSQFVNEPSAEELKVVRDLEESEK